MPSLESHAPNSWAYQNHQSHVGFDARLGQCAGMTPEGRLRVRDEELADFEPATDLSCCESGIQSQLA
jgi:hypothetical protein